MYCGARAQCRMAVCPRPCALRPRCVQCCAKRGVKRCAARGGSRRLR
ncbi:hypothetical protein C7S14_6429 [Burkholderia cepacia]|nr:hypothetical protein C7S14_6429 [Burkholderia cepacia]